MGYGKIHCFGLGCKSNLFYEGPDIIHRIITGSIQFMDIERCAFVKGNTGVAGITGFTLFCSVFTIDGLGQYPCAGSLANTSRATK